MSIYVEILVRAPIDALWAHTQSPALHEQWDLRFSRMEYLPIAHDTDPQRFRYTTRLGCGLEVSGQGETVGHRTLADGSASSALRFGSAEPVSTRAQRFRIVVDVHNRVWGPLFGYRGSFDVEWREVVAGDVPVHVTPQRQERRE